MLLVGTRKSDGCRNWRSLFLACCKSLHIPKKDGFQRLRLINILSQRQRSAHALVGSPSSLKIIDHQGTQSSTTGPCFRRQQWRDVLRRRHGCDGMVTGDQVGGRKGTFPTRTGIGVLSKRPAHCCMMRCWRVNLSLANDKGWSLCWCC